MSLNQITSLVQRQRIKSIVCAAACSGAEITQSITDGDTTHSPSGDAVYDALALKADLASPALTGNPTAPTPSYGDDDTSIATTEFVNDAVPGIVGNIYSETSWADLSSYTSVGSPTATVSGGALHLSGGTNVYTKLLYRTGILTSYDWHYRVVRFKCTTNATTAEGLGIGWYSDGLAAVFAAVNTTAGVNRGTVYIKVTSQVGVTTTLATSTTKLSFTNSTDVIEIYVMLNGLSVEVIAKNVTTGAVPVRVQYDGVWTVSGFQLLSVATRPALYAIEGAQDITVDTWGSHNKKYQTLVRLGNSVQFGLYSDLPQNREPVITGSLIKGGQVLYAAGSNTLTSLITGFADVVRLAPRYATICEGINEAFIGTAVGTTTTAGTYLYKMQTLIDLCLANGITPILLYSTPVTSGAGLQTTINSYNSAITSTYAGQYLIVDISAPLLSGGVLSADYAADAYHPNVLGQKIVANTLLTAIKHLGIATTSVLSPSGLQVNTTIAPSATYVAEIAANPSGVSIPLRFIGDASGRNLRLASKTNASAGTGHGIDFQTVEGGTTINQLISASNLSSATASNFRLYAANVTIGTTITSPTGRLHLPAGTTSASSAPLKFTSGTNMTTAETGAIEYNGTNLFFTRTGTTRENFVFASAVNSVSPTSPNRTITVNIDGTTYYIHAKTTND